MRVSSLLLLLVATVCLAPAAATAQYFLLESRLGRRGGGYSHRSGHVSKKQASCPPAASKPAAACVGRASVCWSPGVADLDCPGSGLCCFDGCANVCPGEGRHVAAAPFVAIEPRPKDPCYPSPCGPGTTCSPSPNGNPICRCEPGLVPKPDTITGCGPECLRDPDCHYGLVCRDQRCIEKPDPCDPSPCGPGAGCSPNHQGHPICRCHPGLIPKPDTITGCGPECVRDPDCHYGQVCHDQRCIEKPDPCDPSPCGPGASCSPNHQGYPICRCHPGLIPKPDTITGCGPECLRDPDCQYGQVCRDQRCVEKPDPCDPSPCGPGASCSVNHLGNPICRCQPGLVPKPDTITGCGPECVVDPDCQYGQVCRDQRCVEKPNPCDPSPCGPGAVCMTNYAGNPICRCEPGLIPKPDTITGCGPECVVDPDCQYGQVCRDRRCVEKPDPCDPSPCGPGATCSTNHLGNPICRCEPGLIPKPDTITGCGPECVRDPDCEAGYICQDQRCVEEPDPCDPSPCGPGTMCMANQFGNPVCRCLGKLVPKPDTISGCGPECEVDPDCGHDQVCEAQLCIQAPDPCDPNPCGPGAECTPVGRDGYQCACPDGYYGDPKLQCVQGECQADEECPDDEACFDYNCESPCRQDTCLKDYFCRVIRHVPTCGLEHVPEPVQVRDLFVIGQSYQQQQQQQQTSVDTASREFVIGSRSRGSVSSEGRSDGARFRQTSVIGASYRRRRRRSIARVAQWGGK